MKKNAFTLGEVLVTLAIVGFVAVMVIPGVIQNTHNRANVLLFRKTLNAISVIVKKDAIEHNNKPSEMIITKAPETFFSQLDIVSSKKNATGSVNCFNIKNGNLSYNTLAGGAKTFSVTGLTTTLLKNGVCIGQNTHTDSDKVVLYIDINGKDSPNMVGVDFFTSYMYIGQSSTGWITSPGDFVGVLKIGSKLNSPDLTDEEREEWLETSKKECYNGGAEYCAEALIKSDWNPDYMKGYVPPKS